ISSRWGEMRSLARQGSEPVAQSLVYVWTSLVSALISKIENVVGVAVYSNWMDCVIGQAWLRVHVVPDVDQVPVRRTGARSLRSMIASMVSPAKTNVSVR